MIINFKWFQVEINVITKMTNSNKIKRQVQKVLAEDGKIPAIKEYRRLSGSGLREAVIYINALLPADAKIGGV